jgi:hypothetical protein
LTFDSDGLALVVGVTGLELNGDVRSNATKRAATSSLDSDGQETGELTTERLIEIAKGNDGPSAPRQHHVVPRFYLDAWAVDKMVRVTDLGVSPRHSYRVKPSQAARVRDFYRIESPEIDAAEMPPLLFETILGEIEGSASPIVNKLVSAEEISPEEVAQFSWYLGFQATRGRSFREDIGFFASEAVKIQFSGITDDAIRKRLEESGTEPTDEAIASAREFIDGIQSGQYFASPQHAQQVGLSGQLAVIVGSTFMFRNWRVFEACAPLITCDEPVVAIGGPTCSRRRDPGYGTAGVVIFPLGPAHLLAMFHPDLELDHLGTIPDLLPSEVAEINLDVAAASSRWVIERGDRRLTTHLTLPWGNSAAARDVLNGVGPRGGELHHFFGNDRWHLSGNPPPWPVARWWANQTARSYMLPIEPDPELVADFDRADYAAWDSPRSSLTGVAFTQSRAHRLDIMTCRVR